jgi:histone-lysine N-methyltransferase SETMAR
MKPSSENVNFFVATLCKNNFKATQIHSLLVEAWGQENVLSLRRVQDISKEFASGERIEFKRAEGSGRKRDIRSVDNINTIKDLVENDQTITINALSEITDISWSTVQRILTEDLKKQSVCARWVPHKLSDHQKNMRVQGAQRILQELEGNVIVIDEKWLYAEPMLPKENLRAWVDPGGDRPRQARRIIADKKFHIIVAMNFRCDHYFEVLQPGQTINAHRYIEFLDTLKNIRRTGTLKIMHDNARPHTAQMTEAFLLQHAILRVPQPPYSPDTNLMDRYIFRNMESDRREKTFHTLDDVKNFLQEFLSSQTRYKLTREMNRLREDLESIISCGGDFL